MKRLPRDKLGMGNVDPAGVIRHGNSKSILRATTHLMKRCCMYPNFVVSTGCDLPPMTLQLHKNGNGTISFSETVRYRRGRAYSSYFALENIANPIQAQNAINAMDR